MPANEAQHFAWFNSGTGARLRLRIEGYQYPRMRPVGERDWDANWLMIVGCVECEQGSWSFRDPCLTTFELQNLILWLASLPNPARPAVAFTEPLLAFEWNVGHERPLTARLRAEALPESRFDRAQRLGAGLELRCKIDAQSLAVCVGELRRQSEQFPAR